MASGPRDNKKREANNEHLAQEHNGVDGPCDVELYHKVANRVKEYEQRRAARVEEGTPPPVVMLLDKLQIHHHDADLHARNQHQEVRDEQAPEHVVVLVMPDGLRVCECMCVSACV